MTFPVFAAMIGPGIVTLGDGGALTVTIPAHRRLTSPKTASGSAPASELCQWATPCVTQTDSRPQQRT